jgi:hypothetical protein
MNYSSACNQKFVNILIDNNNIFRIQLVVLNELVILKYQVQYNVV